ncbi:MAG: metal ABC transporter substrate-binding protein [Candidatus Heimdallarchaeaceae archaeon]
MLNRIQKTVTILVSIALLLSPYSALAITFDRPTQASSLDETSGVISVVTTLSIIADWATQVGDTLFTPASIVTGSEDPHTYALTSSEIQMIGKADLFVRLGLPGIEPWVVNVLDAYPSLNVLTLASEDIMEIDSVSGDLNAHVWMSPIIAKNFVSNITDSVISLDFTNREQYETNRDNYLSELDELIFDIEDYYFNRTNGLKVVVHHPSFFYLLNMLGVERVGIIEEHEGSESSAQHIQEIVNTMIEQNVTTIVTQPQIEERLVLQIARDTNSKIAKLSPMLRDDINDTYIKLIRDDINALLSPEDIEDNQWIVASLAIGSGFLVCSLLLLVYLRFKGSNFKFKKKNEPKNNKE